MSILDPLLFITIFNDKVFLDPSFTNNMFLYVDDILLLKAMILRFMRLSLSHRCFMMTGGSPLLIPGVINKIIPAVTSAVSALVSAI